MNETPRVKISKQKVRLFLRLSIATAILGVLFKVMHWPYSWFLLICGILGIAICYTLQFIQRQPKSLLDYSKLFLLNAFLFHYIFRVFHLPYGYIFTTIAQFALVLFLVLYARHLLFLKEYDNESNTASKKNSIQKGLSYLLYGIAAIGIIVGALFKILHWEFSIINGDVLLTAGILATTIVVVLGLKEV